jgi:hypothetical protein
MLIYHEPLLLNDVCRRAAILVSSISSVQKKRGPYRRAPQWMT